MAMTTRGLRVALIAGFGGMCLIFLIADVDSVRLLDGIRAEDAVLRNASLDRSRRLASVRSYVLLTRTCVRPSRELSNAWAAVLDNLDGYHAFSREETSRLNELRQMLERESRQTEQVEADIIEIDTRVRDVDALQLAATDDAIHRQFEASGRHLGIVLEIALCAALLLAAGCILYIWRIERLNRRRYEEILTGRGALTQLSARLVDAQETERRSISRELHDEVGQTLGAVLVDAGALANRIPAADTASHRYLDNIRVLTDASLNAIRNIALLLRPSMLDDLGLIPALEWQAREVSRRSGVKVKVKAENVSDALPDAVRTCVYRIVQEALTNVSRHSGAKSAEVAVEQKADSLLLTVSDDGSGFDPQKNRGIGLLGMEERVKQLGGTLETRSQPGSGTTLRVTLPL
jgi:signal transduction histidine kinase